MMRVILLMVLCLLVPAHVRADDQADYAFEQKPGAALPVDATFTDAQGRHLRLGDLFTSRPLILALGYFHCPTLCSVVRDDLLEALSHTGLTPRIDYDLVVISIDPHETTTDAAVAAADDKTRYPTKGAEDGWHFLVGDAGSVDAVAAAVGFKSRYDTHLKQFLHPAGLVVLTSAGTVSGYILGVGYHPGDVRTAVTLAGAGGIAKAALPLLLLCFHFDASTGRYTLAIMKVLRLAGLLTVLTIGTVVLLAFRREQRNARLQRLGRNLQRISPQ